MSHPASEPQVLLKTGLRITVPITGSCCEDKMRTLCSEALAAIHVLFTKHVHGQCHGAGLHFLATPPTPWGLVVHATGSIP